MMSVDAVLPLLEDERIRYYLKCEEAVQQSDSRHTAVRTAAAAWEPGWEAAKSMLSAIA